MLALTVVVLWFGLVAVYLVRQWWLNELAQTREGVPAPAPVALVAVEPVARPAAMSAPVVIGGGPARGAAASGRGRVVAPAFTWSGRYATGPAAR